jgi:hypothetical protein
MRSGSAKLASNMSNARLQKKSLTVNVSVHRLAAAEMQQMFHSTTSPPFRGHGLGNLLQGIKGGFPWLVNPFDE